MAEFILKDWYGKEQTFDNETIYVQGTDGELMPFTHGAGNPVIEPLNVTQNGVYTTPVGVNGFGPVSVNVPDLPPVLQSKEATQNGEYTPDSGYDGLSKVTVNVPAPEIKLQEMTITENGEYTADSGFDGLGKVTVEVAGSGGEKKAMYKTGEFTASTDIQEVSHNMGVIPDVIIVTTRGAVTGNYKIVSSVGFSQAIFNATGTQYMGKTVTLGSGGTSMVATSDKGMEFTPTWYENGMVQNVTETTFTIGGSTNALAVGTKYVWEAVSGLV